MQAMLSWMIRSQKYVDCSSAARWCPAIPLTMQLLWGLRKRALTFVIHCNGSCCSRCSASRIFGIWPKVAAPKRWTPAKLDELAQDAADIRSRHPDFSDEAIAKSLSGVNPYRNKYGDFSIAYLRERLADARNSQKDFEQLLEGHLIAVRRLYASFRIDWTSETEAKVTQSFKETARKFSSAP
ncbi:MAG: hypothetical protein ACLPTZ_00555 [Beijerinckiaceae bacterium]